MNSDKIPMTRYVYGICYDNEIVYIGSTKDMKHRWNGYREKYNNPKIIQYKMKIHQFMREKGFDNFSHQIIETFHDITRRDIEQYEGVWQETLEELGFNLLNKQKAGNGNQKDLNSIAYANKQARDKVKIPCELCGKMISRSHIRRHQKSSNCVKE